MSLFPDILPAHPEAAETQRYKLRPLKYGIIGRIYMFFELARERRELSQMSDELLRDIGMTRDDARREQRRSFWDAPAGWRTDAERCLSQPGLL